MNPRPYQSACVESNEASFEECNRILDVLPTGAGKTIIFSFEAQKRIERGERVLILAHREELIDQAITKLHAATGLAAEKERAEFRASLQAKVVVASVQTMIRRLDKWPSDHFGLVVADEAHHVLAGSWQTVVNHFHDHAQVLGVTATPDRGDKKNLGQYFDKVAFEISLFDLINQGYLSPIALKSIPLQIDLSGVRSVAGDFNDADLGSALEPYLGEIAAAIRDHASFRRTLAFLPLIATSHKFVAACRETGLTACHVDGESEDRKDILRRFANYDFDVLSNAMLLTEGYDDPGIDCVVVLRPTRSRPLFAQMVGRGTRCHGGKENLLLLDFLWHHQTHKLVRPAHLIARDDEEAEQITKLAQEKTPALPADLAEQLPMDLQTLAGQATAAREEALRKKLEEQKNKKVKMISAEQFAMQHDSLDAAEYEPTMKWEADAISDKQKKWLERARIDISTVRGKGHASKLLGLFFAKKPAVLASMGQRMKMRQLGHPHWENATEQEARQFFAELRIPKEATLL